MKQYICLFLMFLSFTVYAPNLPKNSMIPKEQSIYVENLYKSQQEAYQIESKLDEKDLNTIKKYNWRTTQYFTIEARRKIREISKDLGIKPEWLYGSMYIECRGDIKRKNPYSGAVGTIQFTPSTANALGTDTGKVIKMSMIEQLELTKQYLQKNTNGRKIHSFQQLYLLIFCPRAAYQCDSFIIANRFSPDSMICKHNPALYQKGDSSLTVSNVKRSLRNKIFIL